MILIPEILTLYLFPFSCTKYFAVKWARLRVIKIVARATELFKIT